MTNMHFFINKKTERNSTGFSPIYNAHFYCFFNDQLAEVEDWAMSTPQLCQNPLTQPARKHYPRFLPLNA